MNTFILLIALGEATVTWTAPLQCADGSALEMFCPITGYRIHAAPCAAPPPRPVIAVTPPDARMYKATSLIPETWCFSVTALSNTKESGHSPDTEKSRKLIESIEPAPPPEVIVQPAAIAVVPDLNDTAMTPVYRVINGVRARDVAGFVPIGTRCAGAVLFEYRRLAYRRVPQDSVSFWRTRPDVVAAPCG